MQVPNVTLEDLQAFQNKHFPGEPQTQPSFLENDLATDEDLGYYPDGVKRTLTDEQIEMFRHSEIHTLLRERQLQTDNAEYEARTKLAAQAEADSQENTVPELNNADLKKATLPRSDHHERLEQRPENQDHRSGGGSLDYGDESSNPPPTEQPQISRAPYQGRRIVSYDD
ncbi:unnamed protein product [Penicillium salamii]|uniref:Uncharacterized protein n=1 Tax=Penicillium salamii TaxID=1612424 RepID=A0A9W4ITF5_9EURO|nr:unnamed protein product [Penicillium salamii]CAG8331027.1 unnamed protein product [Penicillium salamii]CAG8339674.1 unnamed protein product [Penicillium salamii]CAG8372711.1 unnamed protein product [Penicillium salamii]